MQCDYLHVADLSFPLSNATQMTSDQIVLKKERLR